MRKALAFAAARTTPTAVTWWFAPVGGFLASGLLWFLGAPVTFAWWLPDNPVLRGAFDVLVCVVVAYVVMFLAWLAIAPIYFRLGSGIRAALNQMWPQYLMILGGVIVFVGFVGFLQLNVKVPAKLREPPSAPQKPPSESSRIVVSKFVFTPINATNLDLGQKIELHMINRGKIHGYTPLLHFSFKSPEVRLSAAEIEKEMTAVLALSHLPPDNNGREQIEVGVEHYIELPRGLPRETYLDITSGKKAFYLFVALNYKDDSLPPGRYWISEFCAFQTSDIIPSFQLCAGHNGVRLNPT